MIVNDIAYYLPENVLTNEQLDSEHPDWNIHRAAQRTGVLSRRIAKKGETALDLSIQACEIMFSDYPELRDKVDAVVCCTQSPDYIMPPNSAILQKKFGLRKNLFAFDFNLACSGYIYGLEIIRGLLMAKTAKNILFFTADTYSKYISYDDRATATLFGDGGAVTWISATPEVPKPLLQEVIASEFYTDGYNHDKFIIPAGGCRTPKDADTGELVADQNGNKWSQEHINMDGMSVLTFVNTIVIPEIGRFLEKNNVSVDQIDKFIFHQASAIALDSIQRKYRIPKEKVFRNLENVGNVVSASIAVAVKDAFNAGVISPGDTVLLGGFGVGFSGGNVLIKA
jgi:3-oxoacyl-[acyl-carrier-protein] synthase III